MPPIAKFRQALLVCLPIVAAYLVVSVYLVRSDRYGDSMAFAIFFGLPISTMGLPWSLLVAGLEPTFRGKVSTAILEHVATAIFFIGLFINVMWLLQRKTFEVLFRWASILCAIQFVTYFAFR
jgi:hypothetical protein